MVEVTILYKYQGEIDERDNTKGVLFPTGQVMSVTDGEFDIYTAIDTEKAGVVMVDLDKEDNGYINLVEKPNMLLDLLLAN